MEGLSDSELVALARSGERDAFRLLIERHQATAERVALRIVRHPEVAKELRQEAMLQAYLSLDGLRDEERFQSWLYGIVLNVCRGYLRDQRDSHLSLEAASGGSRFGATPAAPEESGPEEAAEAREQHRAVLEAVNGLSPKYRAATLLFYFEQLSVREVAASLGVSASAVKGRLHRARRQLKEQLGPVVWEAEVEAGVEERAREMAKVTIADVIRRERTEEETGRPLINLVVVLKDEAQARVLPIWVGPAEGEAIVIGLSEYRPPRPLTHNLMAQLVEALEARLEEVRIEALREDTFYAVAKLRSGETVREVDCRPSDAMAMAVYTGAPIYVADEVMQTAGFDIPAGEHRLGAGLDGITRELDEFLERLQATMEMEGERSPAERRQEQIDFLFGGGEVGS